jgi:NAD-dependent deacetylase
MDESIKTAAKIIKNSKSLIALTGAGISVPSGIPDFRSKGGLWEKYDPMVYANISSFQRSPEKVWDMIFDMMNLVIYAEPNMAHYTLAKLENLGILKVLVTQNIDGLHGKAGSRKVIEFHGNTEFLECIKCGNSYKAASYKINEKKLPRCSCGSILKPSVIFFGEAIPEIALIESTDFAASADTVLVIGTSSAVYPAAAIPAIAKENGAVIIEFNIEETEITSVLTDFLILGQADETLPAVFNLIID